MRSKHRQTRKRQNRARRSRKQRGGNMAEAQRRVRAWIAGGNVRTPLDLSSLGLTELPKLPATLQILNCYNNQLTALPELPATLQRLYCHYNQLTALPPLPTTLQTLYCSNNPGLLPRLPGESIADYNRRLEPSRIAARLASFKGEAANRRMNAIRLRSTVWGE